MTPSPHHSHHERQVEITVIHVPSSRRRRWKRIGVAALALGVLAAAWGSRSWTRLDPPVLVEGVTTTRPPTTTTAAPTTTSTTITPPTTVPEVVPEVPSEPEVFFIPVPELPPETTTTTAPARKRQRVSTTSAPAFIPVPDFLGQGATTTAPAGSASPPAETPPATAPPTPAPTTIVDAP